MNGKWTLDEEATAFEADDLSVSSYTATLPDESTRKHHMIKMGKGSVGTVVYEPSKGVLLVWRHQLPSDDWGWQLPGSLVLEGEKPMDVAKRRIEQQTGWAPNKLEKLISWWPMVYFADHPFSAFFTDGASWSGPSPDNNEVSDLTWVPIDKLDDHIAKGAVSDGLTLTALLYCMSTGRFNESVAAEQGK